MRIRKIEQKTRDFDIKDPVFEGGTDLNEQTFNQLQTNIENAISEVDDKNTYSTEEQIIGKWHDGRPIYRRVYEGTTDNDEATTITGYLHSANAEILNIYGYIGDNVVQHIIGGYVNGSWHSGIYINNSDIQLWVSNQLYQKPYKVVVEYLRR